jgi:hypothetical protein
MLPDVVQGPDAAGSQSGLRIRERVLPGVPTRAGDAPGADRELHRPQRRGERLEPAQRPGQRCGAAVLSRRDDVGCRGREPGLPGRQEQGRRIAAAFRDGGHGGLPGGSGRRRQGGSRGSPGARAHRSRRRNGSLGAAGLICTRMSAHQMPSGRARTGLRSSSLTSGRSSASRETRSSVSASAAVSFGNPTKFVGPVYQEKQARAGSRTGLGGTP